VKGERKGKEGGVEGGKRERGGATVQAIQM